MAWSTWVAAFCASSAGKSDAREVSVPFVESSSIAFTNDECISGTGNQIAVTVTTIIQ